MLVEKRVLSILLLTVSSRLPILSQTRRQRTWWNPNFARTGDPFWKHPEVQVVERIHTLFASGDLWSRVSSEQQLIWCFCVPPARCTACAGVSVRYTIDSTRLLTHPDDSSPSALSQLKTFAHPNSQQIRVSTKHFTW